MRNYVKRIKSSLALNTILILILIINNVVNIIFVYQSDHVQPNTISNLQENVPALDTFEEKVSHVSLLLIGT